MCSIRQKDPPSTPAHSRRPDDPPNKQHPATHIARVAQMTSDRTAGTLDAAQPYLPRTQWDGSVLRVARRGGPKLSFIRAILFHPADSVSILATTPNKQSSNVLLTTIYVRRLR